MKDRGYQHSAASKNGTVLGQGYSTIVWLPEGERSWALPLRHERITSFETPISESQRATPRSLQNNSTKSFGKYLVDCFS
ncbi:MAG: hypothetical protein O9295_04825 [Microcystis sp. LE18-22.4A]|jgi:hypothetical protein|nr:MULTISPECIES: hypothetical protein [unclassified Microcystis]MCZ8117394.1 hypothetical protein [Microcystis sp. LE18-22.4A]